MNIVEWLLKIAFNRPLKKNKRKSLEHMLQINKLRQEVHESQDRRADLLKHHRAYFTSLSVNMLWQDRRQNPRVNGPRKSKG